MVSIVFALRKITVEILKNEHQLVLIRTIRPNFLTELNSEPLIFYFQPIKKMYEKPSQIL